MPAPGVRITATDAQGRELATWERDGAGRLVAHSDEPEIWVVVCTDDAGGGGTPERPGVPIVMETNVDGATREEATRRAGDLERRYGPCRIARLVFDNQP